MSFSSPQKTCISRPYCNKVIAGKSYKDSDVFWHRKLTMNVQISWFLTTCVPKVVVTKDLVYIFIMKLKGKFWSPAVCLQYVLPHEPLLSILNSRPNDDFDIWWPYFNTFPHQITKRKIRPKLERRGHVFIHTWADFLFVCNRGDTVQYHSGLRSRVLGQAPCYWCS